MNQPTPKNASDRFFAMAGFLLICVLAWLTYHRTLWASFVSWDDLDLIANNDLFRPIRWNQIWLHTSFRLYTPLTFSIHGLLTSLSWAIYGNSQPLPFHLANLLVHVGAVLATWWLLWQLIGNRVAAMMGALLLLLHPMVVEPVAWASSLNTLLAGSLGILAVAVAVKSARCKLCRSRRLLFLFATIVFVLAISGKATALGAVGILLVIDCFALKLPTRAILLRAGIWVACAIPFLIAGRVAQPFGRILPVPAWMRPVIVCDSVGFYILHWLIPFGYGIDYGRKPQVLAFDAITLLHIMTTLVVVGVIIGQSRKRPLLLIGLLIMLAGFGPVVGAVPFDFQSFSSVADRYAYLATLGPAFLMAAAVARLPRQHDSLFAGSLVLCALGFLSYRQTLSWGDTTALMNQALAVNPSSILALEGLGFDHLQNAISPSVSPNRRTAEARQAMNYYGRALDLKPDDETAHANLGTLFFHMGRSADAIKHFSQAGTLATRDPKVLNNWAIAAWKLNDLHESIRLFDQAIQIDPTLTGTYVNKGIVLTQSGDREQAALLYQKALAIDPGQQQARQLLADLDKNR